VAESQQSRQRANNAEERLESRTSTEKDPTVSDGLIKTLLYNIEQSSSLYLRSCLFIFRNKACWIYLLIYHHMQMFIIVINIADNCKTSSIVDIYCSAIMYYFNDLLSNIKLY